MFQNVVSLHIWSTVICGNIRTNGFHWTAKGWAILYLYLLLFQAWFKLWALGNLKTMLYGPRPLRRGGGGHEWFFHFYAFFSEISLRFWCFWNLMCCRKKPLRTHWHANACKWMNRAIHIPNLGHPLWGSQSMQDLASLMRKGRTFQIAGEIPECECLYHQRMTTRCCNEWLYSFMSHSFACNSFYSVFFLQHIRFQNHQNLKLIFEKNA